LSLSLGASNADSQVLRFLARYADGLEELAMTYVRAVFHCFVLLVDRLIGSLRVLSHCRGINRADLEAFANARASTLRWLDLSSCPGISSFPVRSFPCLTSAIGAGNSRTRSRS
jgi:hypothetical protein